ncbi:lipid II flippase MurJ [subsurface metagenome]|nr:oligosaccharide flippase family protein [Clostridia bacterium]
MIKNLFKDIAQYLPSMAIPALVGIVALPIVTRLFLPADYGNYILVITTVSVLSTLVGWVNMSVVRFYPAYERDRKTAEFTDSTIKLTLLSILVISIAFLCILFGLRDHISSNLYNLMRIGILIFILTSLFTVLLSFLRIKRQINWYSGFFIWKSITVFIFGVLFVILFHLGVEGLLWGTILSVGLALPFLWKIALGRLRISGKTIPVKHTIEIAKYSFPLVIGNLAAWILSLSDRYVLQFFRDACEVGIYSVSYQISQNSILLLTSLFALAFNPLAIIIWEKQGEKASQEFLTKGTRYFLLLCLPAVIGLSVLRIPIIKLLSTSNYYSGAKIIPLVALGVFFLGLNQRFGVGLSFYKKTHFFMYSLIISSLLNLGLNFFFIPKYGYMAAAITTLISYVFLLVLTVIFSRRFFVWEFPFKSLAKSTFASAIMGTVVYYIGNNLTSLLWINLILGIFVGAIVYFAALLLLREFEQSEIQAILGLKNKIFTKRKL